MHSISRREFLRLGGLALGSLAFTRHLPNPSPYTDSDLARVCIDKISVYQQPNDKSAILGTWYRDDLVHIYGEVNSGTPDYNPIWYRVWGGYMHRARLQRVKFRFNKPLQVIPEPGRLGEITVPYSQAWKNYKYDGWKKTYRLYYQSVHWIQAVEPGPDDKPWYRILNELDETTYLVPATEVRIIPPEEIAPISPDVPFEQKRIDVNLSTQVVTAFESNVQVFQTKVSTGLAGISTSDVDTATPSGDFNVTVKMPTKHMGAADLAAGIEDYVLPGVPWATFFTDRGHAFHGAYWHDNFGVPMSHGCINMRPEDALWIFRWTLPLTTYETLNPLNLARNGFGTAVYIHP